MAEYSGKKSSSRIDEILLASAKLILKTGNREVDITKLAEETKVPRQTIHAELAKLSTTEISASAKDIIFRMIVSSFLTKAQEIIEVVLSSMPKSSPMERMIAVFRATLNAFRQNPTFGMVVLQQLNLSNTEENLAADREENKSVFQIFAYVDQIIEEARERDELDKEVAERLEPFEIRHIVFTVTRGLLRASYLEECYPINNDRLPLDKKGLSLKNIEIEVLRILQLYCSEKAKNKIEENIEDVKRG
jgi:AcrR family transcriptional regulator